MLLGDGGSGDDRLKLPGRRGGQHHRLGRLQGQADARGGRRAVAEQQVLEGRIDRGLFQEDFHAAGDVADGLAAARRPPADNRGADRRLLGGAVGAELRAGGFFTSAHGLLLCGNGVERLGDWEAVYTILSFEGRVNRGAAYFLAVIAASDFS